MVEYARQHSGGNTSGGLPAVSIMQRDFYILQRLLEKIFTAPSLDEYRGNRVSPGPDVDLSNDEAVLDYIRATATTTFHQCGTCRMGQDASAVVDEQLRVRGLENLSVVDASIMPTVTSGNTNAPVIMIAEKASDMILGDAS